jgi:hypothetical protein
MGSATHPNYKNLVQFLFVSKGNLQYHERVSLGMFTISK